MTEIARGQARFMKYRSGELWYDLYWNASDDDLDDQGFPRLHPRRLSFPIPLDDAGDGDFTPEMKGMQVLRWARKYVERLAMELQSD